MFFLRPSIAKATRLSSSKPSSYCFWSQVTPLSAYVSRSISPTSTISTCRYAHQSYGGDDMTGHPKSDRANEAAHHEHPGPKSPADEDRSSSSDQGKQQNHDQKSPSQGQKQDSSNSSERGGQSPQPKINNPSQPPEHASEDVRRHNEAVANSHDRPVNQLDEDGKVDKGFWTGELSFFPLPFSPPSSLRSHRRF